MHSHIHALGQCRKLIRRLGLTPVIAGDTAGSAREVRDWNDPAKVSLAPPMAAELYGLHVFAAEVEDDPTNTTRFVVLADRRPVPSRDDLPGPAMTSFVFRVRNVPLRAVQGAGRVRHQRHQHDPAGSYMVGDEFAATMFMADVEGHPEDHRCAGA